MNKELENALNDYYRLARELRFAMINEIKELMKANHLKSIFANYYQDKIPAVFIFCFGECESICVNSIKIKDDNLVIASEHEEIDLWTIDMDGWENILLFVEDVVKIENGSYFEL